MWSPWIHSTNENGPVPTALVLAFGPSIVSLSRMFSTWKKSKIAAQGCAVEITTEYLSGFVQVVSGGTNPVMMPAVSLKSRIRFRL